MSSLIVIRRRSCIGHDGSPETTSRVSYTPENLHKSAPSELPVSASQEKGPMSSFNDVSDLAERRRIQNRIAQRKYRKKLKKRLEQLDEGAFRENQELSVQQQETLLNDSSCTPLQTARPKPIPTLKTQNLYNSFKDATLEQTVEQHDVPGSTYNEQTYLEPWTLSDDGAPVSIEVSRAPVPTKVSRAYAAFMKALGACMECRRRWIGCTMEHWDLSLFETQYSCRHMPIPSYPVITAEEAEVSEGNSNDRVNNSSLQGTESSNRSNEPTTPQSLTQSEASMESLMGEEICLEQKKGDILRRVTLHVSNLIRTIFIQVRGAQHSVTASETQAQLSSQKDSTSSRSNESYRSTKRRRLSEKDNFGSDDEDDGRRQPESIQTPNDEESDPKMFACPYFKYNPGRYKTERNCPGPGWPSVHRVKEHLYRRHRQPRFRCGRCWQPFKDEASFLDHQRTPQPCELGEQEYVEGFDAAQEKRLKARKRANPDLSEAERWCEVFKILFPHVDHDKIPSPFYEYGELSSSSESPDRLAECEEYLLREVPARLHQALSRELDRDLEAVEEGLKKKAIACVKDLIPELFRELRRPKRSDRRAAPAEPLQPPPSQTDNIQNEDDGPDLEQIILGGLGSVITTLEYSGFGFGEGSLAESLSEPSSWDDPLSGLDLSEADCSLQLTPGTAGLLPDMDGWHLVDFDEITSDRHLNQYLPGHNSLDGPLENHLSTEFNGGDLEGAVTLPELPSDFAESYLEEQSFEIASYESETGHCSSDRVDS